MHLSAPHCLRKRLLKLGCSSEVVGCLSSMHKAHDLTLNTAKETMKPLAALRSGRRERPSQLHTTTGARKTLACSGTLLTFYKEINYW